MIKRKIPSSTHPEFGRLDFREEDRSEVSPFCMLCLERDLSDCLNREISTTINNLLLIFLNPLIFSVKNNVVPLRYLTLIKRGRGV